MGTMASDPLPPRAQRQRRPVGVVPGLPQPVALVGAGRPLEAVGAEPGRDLLRARRLLGDGCGGAVELQQQGRAGRVALQLRVGDAGAHLHVVQQLDAGDGDAGLQDGDDALHGAGQAVELADGGAHGLGDAVQAQRDLGDDAQRALAADHQVRQVIAGRGLADAPAGADQAAIGQRDLQAQYVFPYGAVADGGGAAGAGGAHAADGAFAAGVHGEEQALVAQMGVQGLAGHAGFDPAVHVGGVDLQHAGHARQVEADAAADGGDVPLQAGAGAERHDGDAVLVAQGQDARCLLRPLDERHGVRQHAGLGVLPVRVLLAQGGVGGDAVAEDAAGLGDDGVNGACHGRGCPGWAGTLPRAGGPRHPARCAAGVAARAARSNRGPGASRTAV